MGADEVATSEERELNLHLGPVEQVYDTIFLLHDSDHFDVRDVLQRIDHQAVALHLNMLDETVEQKVERLKSVTQSVRGARNEVPDGV